MVAPVEMQPIRVHVARYAPGMAPLPLLVQFHVIDASHQGLAALSAKLTHNDHQPFLKRRPTLGTTRKRPTHPEE